MEWTDPRYTDVVARYREAKAEAGPAPDRPGRKKGRRYGDPFVIVVDPVTMKPHTVGR
ncbi:hypothetical protein OG875_16425 [Streptomyces sp. NBC_01498]|uniref:hypothetical protein n=1 Tax=Streptomyces sp. NBC_01498 TaxID=2975870 RepID=UPI002E7ADAA0|nr:hypothetical protein [Streptomyces sp. NBC_01498]WTL26040.1 hypothetical protein OG875_16425 [Streptomyces sp. NBC_01498]